jgi:hypothetical protein
MFPQSSLTPASSLPLTPKLLQMRLQVTPSVLLFEIPPSYDNRRYRFAGTSGPLPDSNRRPPYHRATRREARASAESRGHEVAEEKGIGHRRVTVSGRRCSRWCSLNAPSRWGHSLSRSTLRRPSAFPCRPGRGGAGAARQCLGHGVRHCSISARSGAVSVVSFAGELAFQSRCCGCDRRRVRVVCGALAGGLV